MNEVKIQKKRHIGDMHDVGDRIYSDMIKKLREKLKSVYNSTFQYEESGSSDAI